MVDRCILCKQAGEEDWVQCDACAGWVHMRCAARSSDELQASDIRFECAKCVEAAKRPKRRRTEVNYARLDKGIVEVGQTHPHVQFFAKDVEETPVSDSPPEIDTFFSVPDASPLRIPKQWFHLLDMYIESHQFTPRAIAATLGEDVRAPVMDSVTQLGVKGWTLGKWRDYHEMGPQRRKNLTRHGTLNVITLEFSGTALANYVTRPRQVREADLVDRVWPEGQPKPKVQLYSLTGAANSFTDFHIDFAGSSVFYHLISGAKSFIFVKPTPRNLKQYEKWCRSSDQTDIWFPSLLKHPSDAFQVDVRAGDSLLIPSGWIHAVYTPVDAVVVGGNFLTLKDLEMQKTIAELEERTNVPKQFRFPMFSQVLKYTNEYLTRNMTPPDQEDFSKSDPIKPEVKAEDAKSDQKDTGLGELNLGQIETHRNRSSLGPNETSSKSEKIAAEAESRITNTE